MGISWQGERGYQQPIITVWGVEGGTYSVKHELVGHALNVVDAELSPDGFSLLSASADWTAKLWSLDTNSCTQTFVGHTGELLSAKFSPRDSLAVTASEDQTARVWSLDDGECVHVFTHSFGFDNALDGAVFTPDGASVLTTSRSSAITTCLWSLEHATCLQEIPGAASFSSTSSMMMINHNGMRQIWSVRSQVCECVQRLGSTPPYTYTSRKASASFTRDGTAILMASHRGVADLHGLTKSRQIATFNWSAELETREQRKDVGFDHLHLYITSLEVSGDGSRVLMVVEASPIAMVWNAETGELVRAIRHDGGNYISCAKISADGTMVLTSGTGVLTKLFSVETGECLQTFESINIFFAH